MLQVWELVFGGSCTWRGLFLELYGTTIRFLGVFVFNIWVKGTLRTLS